MATRLDSTRKSSAFRRLSLSTLTGRSLQILFAGDWRPYFHIHDLDFARLTNATKPPPATLLATTNPLILNSCKAWPHVMRLHVRATDGKDVVRGLKSSRKRHVQCDKKVRDEVEGLMKKGDCGSSLWNVGHALELLTRLRQSTQTSLPMPSFCNTSPA